MCYLLPERQLLLCGDEDAAIRGTQLAESEFIAAVSAIADGIYLKRFLEKVLNHKVVLELRMDSSAARALLKKRGVQRTRHISTGLLWVQDKVSAREVAVKPLAGQTNPADMGTKAHGQQRLSYLLGNCGSIRDWRRTTCSSRRAPSSSSTASTTSSSTCSLGSRYGCAARGVLHPKREERGCCGRNAQ